MPMARRGRWALLVGFVPIVLVLACVGTRSIQGPVRGRAALYDGVERDDLVARLRCQGYGIHGAHRTDEELRVFDSRDGFRFLFAYRGLAPAGCGLEVLHPLYRMAYVPLERRFVLDVGTLRLEPWEDLLEAPEGLSTADLNRHLFYLRHYYLKGFRRERARAELARYVPALHALFDRGLQVLPPMDRDRFGSTKDSLDQLRAIEAAVGYARPPEQEALFAAASAGDAEKVRVLLAEGVDPDAWNATHAAAIHLAASAKHTEVVRALLEGGADVDRREEGLGNTALIDALLRSDEETARLLIEHGADVALASRGRTPLQLAAGHGIASLVRLLIERGAVARAREERHVVAALHSAARAGRTEVVEVLLAAGVPTDAGLPGFTAFMQAAWKGKLETAQLLLAAGADPNAVSVTGKTALAYAREENRVEVVAWLERLGARE
jgi:ankyrin repeat protein